MLLCDDRKPDRIQIAQFRGFLQESGVTIFDEFFVVFAQTVQESCVYEELTCLQYVLVQLTINSE